MIHHNLMVIFVISIYCRRLNSLSDWPEIFILLNRKWKSKSLLCSEIMNFNFFHSTALYIHVTRLYVYVIMLHVCTSMLHIARMLYMYVITWMLSVFHLIIFVSKFNNYCIFFLFLVGRSICSLTIEKTIKKKQLNPPPHHHHPVFSR